MSFLKRATSPLFMAFSVFVNAAIAAENTSNAHMSLYIFREGLPQRDVELRVDGKLVGKTNRYGAMRASVSPGTHYFELFRGGRSIYGVEYETVSDETLQFIVAQPSPGLPASADIDSSQSVKLPAVAGSTIQDSPTTSIKGQVTSLEGGNPVPGARIFVSGMPGAIKTDGQGYFEKTLPAGIYSISFVHADFSTQIRKNVELRSQEDNVFSVELTPSGLELGEFTVKAPALEGGVLSLVDEKQNSSSVKEVLSAEQMSAAGDSDAGSALKRVTGLTLIDGKFIYVRGLGERYASTTMNGANLPSPDPTRRVVPLDLFPTGALSSVVIQKTYSPDMPGDFSGGVVQLRTLTQLPEETSNRFSVSTGGNSESTFQEGDTYEGGDLDLLGRDDGTRELPGLVESATEGGAIPGTLPETAAESFPQVYQVSGKTLMPDLGVKLNISDIYQGIDTGYAWGYNVALNYSNKWRRRIRDEKTFSGDGQGGLVIENELTETKTENEIDLGGLANFILEVGNNHIFESSTFLTRKSTNTVVVEEGFLSENELDVRDTTLEWVERQLLSQQFKGKHYVSGLNDMEVDWQITYSQASRYEPDTRFYRYTKPQSSDNFVLSSANLHQITYEDLQDDTLDTGIDFMLPVYDLWGMQAKFKAGVSLVDKTRDSEFLRFNFISPPGVDRALLDNDNPEEIFNDENLGGPDDSASLFTINNTTLPTDNYEASQTLTSTYLLGELGVTQKLTLMGGARVEDNDQEVVTFDLTDPDQSSIGRISSRDVLPAFSATYKFTDQVQLRAAVSSTLNRPDFKELSEAPYIDPETRDVIRGNPDLEQAEINNFDLRLDRYYTHFEFISASAFFKDFSNPIEKTKIPGGGEVDVFTFTNVESAQNFGVEFESRFWLSRFFGKNWSHFYFESNLSLIESEVSIGDNPGRLTSEVRPLQGQSPWIINMIMGYEDLVARTRASLSLNMFGERITDVGAQGIPDAYEQPVPLLNAVYSTELYEGAEDKMDLSFKIKNILDPEFRVERGGELEDSYYKGITISLALKYDWK